MSDKRFLQAGFEKQLAHVIEECGEVLAAAGKTQTILAMCDLMQQMRDALVIGHQSKFSNEALAAFDKFNTIK